MLHRFGIQTTTGGECVYQMLKAIWPSIQHLPNHLPASAHITTSAMMCYFLYWLIQLPLLLIPVHKIRWLFNIKSVIVPICWLSMFIWALVRTGGASGTGIYNQPPTIHGSKATWAWFGAVNSALGNFATLGVNIPDFTRFAKSPRAQFGQMLVIPVAFTFFAFIGLTVTSSGYEIYGKGYLWDPLTLIDQWCDLLLYRGSPTLSNNIPLLGTTALLPSSPHSHSPLPPLPPTSEPTPSPAPTT